MSSRSRSSSQPRENRRIYVTGFSYKEDEHDMKKIFKKYGKVEDFSWKGKYFFVVNSGSVFNVCRHMKPQMRQRRL